MNPIDMASLGLWLFAIIIIFEMVNVFSFLFVRRDAYGGGGTSA